MTITDEDKAELSLSSRLRAAACGIAEGNVADPHGHHVGLLRKAADALAAAEAERDRMKKALEEIIEFDWWDGLGDEPDGTDGKCAEIARAALGDTPCP